MSRMLCSFLPCFVDRERMFSMQHSIYLVPEVSFILVFVFLC